MNGFCVCAPNLFLCRGMTIVRDPDGKLTLLNPCQSISDEEQKLLQKIGSVRWIASSSPDHVAEWTKRYFEAQFVSLEETANATKISEGFLFFPQHNRTLVATSADSIWERGGKLLTVSKTVANLVGVDQVILPSGKLKSGPLTIELASEPSRKLSFWTMAWLGIFAIDMIVLFRLMSS